MVEGPGCTHNGEKVRKAAVGRRVAGVAGIAASKVAAAIRGRTLVGSITLGKQLWMIFAADGCEETAVRCHFGMAGSLHCDNFPPLGRKLLTLLIRFEPACELRLHDSSAVLADARAAREAVRTMCTRDVCSPSFDIDAAVLAVASAPADRMIADVLLDQNALPGCGNIIKNEGLHRAATDPRSLLNTLGRDKLRAIVTEVRAFSAAWCRGRQPGCHVYNRTQCVDCGAAVSMCKLGDVGAPRPTFWCTAACGAKRTLGDAAAAAAWAMAGKRKRLDSGSAAAAPRHSDPWVAAAAGAARPPSAAAPSAAAPSAAGSGADSGAPAAAASAAPAPASAPASAAASTRPRCKLHGDRLVTLRRVRKAGANEGRLFYSCGGKGCELFKWADEGFPRCACAHAPIAGLRVSKQQQSGGRWFFGCRSGAKTRCAHFAWAPPDVAQGFDGLLRPLT